MEAIPFLVAFKGYPQRNNALRMQCDSQAFLFYKYSFFGHFNFNRKRKQTAVTNITVRFRMVYLT